MNPTDRDASAGQRMADDITERLARVEALLNTMATRADLARLEERVGAACETANNFIQAKTQYNDHLETRMRTVEGVVSGVTVKLAIIGVVSAAALTGLIGMFIRMFEGAVK